MNSAETNLLILQYPPKFPKSVHLYITNDCNLNCEKCYYRSENDPLQQLSLEKIRSLFAEWKNFRLTSIAIGGGEPLLHPDIQEIVEISKKMGFFPFGLPPS